MTILITEAEAGVMRPQAQDTGRLGSPLGTARSPGVGVGAAEPGRPHLQAPEQKAELRPADGVPTSQRGPAAPFPRRVLPTPPSQAFHG